MVRRTFKNRRTFFIAVIFATLVMGSAIFVYSLVSTIPAPGRITERAVIESTKIFDRTGKIILYEIHGEEKRTVIPLADIPLSLRQATIAAEDDAFYEHHGLDWKGIARAFFKNIVEGNISQGGSTITQQLVKKSLLSDERTFARKIKEALLAVMVERKYSKDEILELYLNQIPYGSNAYGIASAGQTFFGKEVKDLSLAESALLAALPKAPTYYSPYGSHKDELAKRKDWILDRMAEEGFVSKEELAHGKKISLRFLPPKQTIRAPHFVLYLREYLNEKYGEEFVEKGGLKVTSTLDWKLQEEAEKIVKEGAEQNEKSVQAFNASLTAIDPQTGEVLAMVGSRNYFEKPLPGGCSPGVNCKFDPHVNIVTRFRQPGSAFKPFVYATALQKGYTPETVLFDAPTEFNANCNSDGTPGPNILDPKDCYHPQNYDGKYRGPVPLRQAIAQSLNVPSVKLLYLAGVKDSIDTAARMGITSLGDAGRYGLTLVLGGAEVSLFEMVSAFGVFAQDGVLHPKTTILRVETSQGVLLEEKKDSALPVIDTEVARTLNDMLSDNDARIPVFSPQSSLYFPDRKVAAKTGTTQDYRDAWVIGYTPSLVAGVWVGNNDNTAMNQSGLSVMVAAPIWHKFMDMALKDKPDEGFVSPEHRLSEKLVMRGVYRSGAVVRTDRISRKLATEWTPLELVEENAFGEIKSILAHVRKEDPLGDQPQDPYTDPQYKNWQEAINRWITANSLPSSTPPREFDDLHTPAKRPKIEFLSPSATELSSLAEVSIKIFSAFPLREVSLFINDELENSRTAPIISDRLSFPLVKELPAGAYRIKITAYDAVGNSESVSKEIKISESR